MGKWVLVSIFLIVAIVTAFVVFAVTGDRRSALAFEQRSIDGSSPMWRFTKLGKLRRIGRRSSWVS